MPIWNAIKMQPVLSEPVVSYKALIMIHKLFLRGPHVVMSEALPHRSLLDSLSQYASNGIGTRK